MMMMMKVFNVYVGADDGESQVSRTRVYGIRKDWKLKPYKQSKAPL